MHHDPLTDPETVLHPADAASGRSACSTPSPAVASLVVVTGARCRRKPFPASSSLVGRIPAASPRPLRIAGRTSLSALEYPRCLSPCLDSRLHQLPAPETWRVPDEVVICALAMLNFFAQGSAGFAGTCFGRRRVMSRCGCCFEGSIHLLF